MKEYKTRVQEGSTLITDAENIAKCGSERVGGKAFNLSLLKRAGIPVPPFSVLPAEAFQHQYGESILPPDVIREMEAYRSRFSGRVAVRSSANIEDGASLSMAGVFRSEYVDIDQSLAEAVLRIYQQASSDEVREYLQLHGINPDDVRISVIIQELIEADMAGVMYTKVNGEKMLVQVAPGLGEKLVDGEHEGEQIITDRQGRIIKGNDTGVQRHVIHALAENARRIEELFQGVPQDIEFAIANGTLHIVQSRPQTVDFEGIETEITLDDVVRMTRKKFHALAEAEKQKLGTSQAVFSCSNYTELLPHPAEMDCGVFAYIFTGTEGTPGAIQLGRREMGYTLADESVGYMSYVGGKPYYSIAGDALNYYTGFPETQDHYIQILVEEYLTKIAENPALGEYPEMYTYLQNPSLRDLEERFGQKDAQKMFETYSRFEQHMAEQADSYASEFHMKHLPAIEKFIRNRAELDVKGMNPEQLSEYIHGVLEHLRTESCVAFVKSARLGFFYSKMLQGRLQNVFPDSVEADNAFGRLSQGLDGSMITDANVSIAEAPTDEEALAIAAGLVGHYSSEMLEIRRPRFTDEPKQLEDYVDGIRSGGYKDIFEKQRAERQEYVHEILHMLPENERESFKKVVENAQAYMSLRETVKYHFTREYALVRTALVELEQKLNLPEGSLFFVYPWEVEQVVKDPGSFQGKIAERQQIFQLNEQLDLPVVIRESDIDALQAHSTEEMHRGIQKGIFLAEGVDIVDGVILNADEFQDAAELRRMCDTLNQAGERIILVAQQMNLTHDPFIYKAAGLIIQNAGIVSHGAQRARELGRGALGGINTRNLSTGTRVNFSPSGRAVEVLS